MSSLISSYLCSRGWEINKSREIKDKKLLKYGSGEEWRRLAGWTELLIKKC